ncbi:hypothetical protein DBV15_11999 [Temnothorax longispinosus]|uniref:Uncharacterized protein n=1 Tax=Temnothorax longispinosus TaxID=300112 RepID=A0A4S2JRI4_9HYME|nr:hypothetical protein DBV15_11999 [Temnothorax longispinosus]
MIYEEFPSCSPQCKSNINYRISNIRQGIKIQCPVDSLISGQRHIRYTTQITSGSIPNSSLELTNPTIPDGMDRGWIAATTPRRRLKTPFAAGEDDVCASLASEPREGSSCAAMGEGSEGTGESPAATTTGVGVRIIRKNLFSNVNINQHSTTQNIRLDEKQTTMTITCHSIKYIYEHVHSRLELTNPTIPDGMDRGWIAATTPRRRLKTPFAAGEDDVCASLASEPREGSSCAAMGEGSEGTGESPAATTTGVGDAANIGMRKMAGTWTNVEIQFSPAKTRAKWSCSYGVYYHTHTTSTLIKKIQGNVYLPRCALHAHKPPARSRQFTISKHKQNYEWLQVAWNAMAAGLAGSERWGRGFWDAKRLVRRSLSVNLLYGILISSCPASTVKIYAYTG